MQISKFKGTVYVNIREWYDKDGKLAPGKQRTLYAQSVITKHMHNIAVVCKW